MPPTLIVIRAVAAPFATATILPSRTLCALIFHLVDPFTGSSPADCCELSSRAFQVSRCTQERERARLRRHGTHVAWTSAAISDRI